MNIYVHMYRPSRLSKAILERLTFCPFGLPFVKQTNIPDEIQGKYEIVTWLNMTDLSAGL